jgi:voltage-gated potassium channel
MVFVQQAVAAIVLVTLTLVLQSAGMAVLIQWARTHLPAGPSRPDRFRSALVVVRLTSLIICMHLLEILLWAWFYRAKCLATWESAFYFSAASYSTVGYGDLVLQPAWRQLGPIESLTGVLMCALSAGFLFTVVLRLVERDELANQLSQRTGGA